MPPRTNEAGRSADPDRMSLVHLRHEEDGVVVQAAVSPDRGANVLGLSIQREGWLWPYPILEPVDLATVAGKPTSFGVPILAPTPGRVGPNQNGLFTFEGRTWRVSPTRHGFLRDRGWTVAERGPAHLVCTTRVVPPDPAPDDLFPFEFEATYELRLHARGLRGRLDLVNTSSRPQPLSAGFHPYLRCRRDDRGGGPPRVLLPAAEEWELTGDDEPTPTSRRMPVSTERDFRKGRALPETEHWDHVFTALSPDEDGWVTAWIEADGTARVRSDEPRGRDVRLRTRHYLRVPLAGLEPETSPVAHLQLFTPPGRSSVCLEPLANPPNALNMAEIPEATVRPLARGERRSFAYEVGMEVVEAVPGPS